MLKVAMTKEFFLIKNGPTANIYSVDLPDRLLIELSWHSSALVSCSWQLLDTCFESFYHFNDFQIFELNKTSGGEKAMYGTLDMNKDGEE